jgi:hypothetical protein
MDRGNTYLKSHELVTEHQNITQYIFVKRRPNIVDEIGQGNATLRL